ncbi:hypothetical protein CS033_04948 [Phocaeicola vulgatus]|nr:hypothetical protein [Phocaeicola vulgatus]
MADDAVVFLYRSGQEAGNILESDQRNIKAVTETDKTGSLVAGVNVKDAGQPGGLIGNNTYGTTSQATKPHHHIFSKVRHHLEEILVIQHRFDDILYIIRHVRIFGNDSLQRLHLTMDVIVAGNQRRILHIVGRQETQQFADTHQRFLLIIAHKMGHTAFAAVSLGTTQFLLAHLLVSHGLHHIRTRDKHVALLLHHKDKVGQCRGIAGASGTRSQNSGNLGDNT